MEKYGTYLVYKNKYTGEIKRIPLTDEEEIEKTASSDEWVELDKDPEN